jgi:hypothetical protein
VEMAGKSKRPVANLPVIVGLPKPEIAISATSAREPPFDTANNGSGQFACDLHRWGSSRPKAGARNTEMVAEKRAVADAMTLGPWANGGNTIRVA